MYKIEIENNVTHQKYTYDNVEDKNNGKKLFYNFNLDTSNLDDGEYTLSLYDGNKLITSELLKIGDFNNKSIQYSKGNNIYIDTKSKIDINKIDVAATGIKLGNSTFTEIPVVFDFSNVTDMQYMFDRCSYIKSIPTINTSNVTNMYNMFSYCETLQSIPTLNTSNVTNMSCMFYACTKLQSLPLLDCGNITSMNVFWGYGDIYTLTNIGGFKDLKISITSYFLDKTPNLTTDSLMNVINNLYDLTANGLSGQSLKFGSTNLNKLTEEQIAVATNKGWTLIA